MSNLIEKPNPKLAKREKVLIMSAILGFILFLVGIIVWSFTQNTLFLIFSVVGIVSIIIGKFVSGFQTIESWEDLPNVYKESMENKEKGTINNPLIIDNTIELPNKLQIEKSDNFIVFQDCNIFSLQLASCQNITLKNCYIDLFNLNSCQKITLENCRIKACYATKCSDINYTHSTFEKVLELYYCQGNKIVDCSIKKIKLNQAQENTIRFCSINKIRIELSKNNIFESNSIPDKQKVKSSTSKFNDFVDKWSLKSWLINGLILLPIIFILTVVLDLIQLSLLFLLIFFLIFNFTILMQHFAERHAKKKRNSQI